MVWVKWARQMEATITSVDTPSNTQKRAYFTLGSDFLPDKECKGYNEWEQFNHKYPLYYKISISNIQIQMGVADKVQVGKDPQVGKWTGIFTDFQHLTQQELLLIWDKFLDVTNAKWVDFQDWKRLYPGRKRQTIAYIPIHPKTYTNYKSWGVFRPVCRSFNEFLDIFKTASQNPTYLTFYMTLPDCLDRLSTDLNKSYFITATLDFEMKWKCYNNKTWTLSEQPPTAIVCENK